MEKITGHISLLFMLFVPGLLSAQTYLSENFDSGIPGGWTVSNNVCPGHGTGYWKWQGTSNGWRGYGMSYTLDGTEFAIVDSDELGIFAWCDQTLTSPVFDPTASTQLELSFDYYYRKYFTDIGSVEVFDGSTWVQVASYSSTAGSWLSPAQAIIDLTPYINPSMQIRFRYQANWDWYWAIDNAEVYNPVILASELLEFTAGSTQSGVLLEWQTASETNNDHFTIERSTDGKSFQSAGTVQGAGNSNRVTRYEFLDEHIEPASGTPVELYYRLGQTDFNGDTQFSDIVSVLHKPMQKDRMQVYPNPAHDFVHVSIEPTNANANEIIISDLLGNTVYKASVDNNDKSSFMIDVAEFERGLYNVLIFGSGVTQSRFLVLN